MGIGRISAGVAALGVGWTVGSPALAQDSDDLTIDEIVVTAAKRAQSLQDVSIAITAIGGDTLEKLNVKDIQDLYVQTPSLSFSRAGGEGQIYIRGIGSSAFGVTNDPSVALHIDGVYLGIANMGLTQFLDVERVEILRGPQGTLYGRNATAGVVNIISRKPTDEAEGYLRASYGNYDRKELHGAASGPLSDTLKVRVAARWLEDDGYTNDLVPGGAENIDDQNMLAVRGTIVFEPNDRFTATLIGDWTEFDSSNRSAKPLDDLSFAAIIGTAPQPGFHETRNNLDTFFDWETGGFSLNIDWDLSDSVTLSSLTSFRTYDSDFFFNTDGTEAEITRSTFQYETDQFSQELRLASNGLEGWSWLLGGYYYTDDKAGALGLGRATHPSFGEVSFIIPNDDKTDAYAVFGSVSKELGEALTATIGMRYSDETKEDITSVGAIFGDFTGLASNGAVTLFGAPREEKVSWDNFTPHFGLEYRPNDDTLLFANVSKGFKSGGFNAFDRTPSFDPETIWSYEVGVKSDLAEGRARLNGTAFYYDYKNLQVSAFQDGLTVTTNAAQATVWGLEAEMNARASEALVINASATYLDATYDEFISTFGNATGVDLSGNRLVNAPKFKFNTNAVYTIEMSGGAWVDVFGQLSYQSRIFHTQNNENLIGEGSLALVDARVSYHTEDGRWEIAVYGKNLFDKEYYQNTVRFTSLSQGNPADANNIGAALGYPAEGISYGVQVGYRF